MPFEQNGDIVLPCNSILESGYEGYAIRYEFHSKVLVDKENKVGRNKIENILYGEATHLLVVRSQMCADVLCSEYLRFSLPNMAFHKTELKPFFILQNCC